jgi:alpha-galactosidase
MGSNDWKRLGCHVSKQLLLESSNNLISLSLRDVGYNYIVLDACWSNGRDQYRKIEVALEKLLHGTKWIADRIHKQNLL